MLTPVLAGHPDWTRLELVSNRTTLALRCRWLRDRYRPV